MSETDKFYASVREMKIITEIKFREEDYKEMDRIMSTLVSEGWSVKSEREERFEYKGNTAKTTTFVLIRTI
jgi:hypothetical protein